MSDAPDDSRRTLDYATPLPRRSRIRRRAIIVVALLAIVLGVIPATRTAIRRWQAAQERAFRLAIFEAAMSRPLAGGQVAYDEDAARAAPLLPDAANYVTLAHYAQPVARRVPAEWTALQSIVAGSTPRPPILFCGPRDVPGLAGERQLVVVQIESLLGVRDGQNVWTFDVRSTLQTYDGTIGSRQYRVEVPTPIEWNDWQRHRVRFFTGVADPNDPQQFTIAFDVNGEPGAIECEIDPAPRFALRPRPTTSATKGAP